VVGKIKLVSTSINW